MAKLKGKTVLITGGAGGIGLCLAAQFAKAGSSLIISDINAEALESARAKLQGLCADVATYKVDITKRRQVKDMASDILERFGGLDILINNAGLGFSAELADTDIDMWKKLIDVNLMGTLYHVDAFLPSMKERGKGQIVNVSSGQAILRLPTWGAYAAVKSALGAYSETLYYELRGHGIHVTTIYPFMVNTGFYSDIEGESFGAKLSMKLVPYYSMSPEKAGKIIFKAVKKKKKVEMTHPANDLIFYSKFLPFVPDIVGFTSNYFLSKKD